MALYDILCRECGHIDYDQRVASGAQPPACRCGSTKTEKMFPEIGGYKMASGGSSTKPKNTFKPTKKAK